MTESKLCQSKLYSILNSRYSNNEERVKVLVNGKWGVGKTYLINLLQEKMLDRKILHLSAFGAETITQLEQELKYKLIIDAYPQIASITEFINLGWGELLEQYLKSKGFDVWKAMPLNKLMTSHRYIICLDDVERKSPNIPIEALLGFAERISSVADLLLIANKEELSSEDKAKFKKIQEKIVDYNYELYTPGEEAFDTILGETHESATKYTIKHFCQLHGVSNLRTVKKISSLVGRLTNTHKKLPEGIVEICCCIVKEHEEEGDVNIQSYNASLWSKYKLSMGKYYAIGKEILNFYLTLQEDFYYLTRMLNPEKLAPDENLYIQLQEHLCWTEQKLVTEISTLEYKIKSQDSHYFSSIPSLIRLCAFVGFFKETYLLDLDYNQMLESAEELSKKLLHRVPVYQVIDSNFLGMGEEFSKHIVDLVNRINSQILVLHKEKSSEEFEKHLAVKNYNKCLDIFLKCEDMDVSYVFNGLLRKSIDYDYLKFCNRLFHSASSRKSDNTRFLTELVDKTDDKVIKRRIEMIKR